MFASQTIDGQHAVQYLVVRQFTHPDNKQIMVDRHVTAVAFDNIVKIIHDYVQYIFFRGIQHDHTLIEMGGHATKYFFFANRIGTK